MIYFFTTDDETGLYSAIFYAYEKKIFPDGVFCGNEQISFTDTAIKITPDEQKALRVKKCLYGSRTKRAASDIAVAIKNGESDKLTIIFNYAKLVIDNKNKDISSNFANNCVLAFADLIRRVFNEVHRFKGFLRFEQSAKGFLYAHYRPDNDITAYLMPHFFARLNELPFIIHDVKRNVIGMSDGKSYKTFYAKDLTVTVFISEEEKNFKALWRTYYDSVNVKERKNLKQMLNYMPARYHADLPEKNGFSQ